MKSRLTGTRESSCVAKADAALSLQEELVAAIHGAFDVAVEIAVQQVTKLVGQATGGAYEEMRQENESLKQRLHRAEALLDCARREERDGGSPPPVKRKTDATDYSEQPHLRCNAKKSKVGSVHGGRGDTAPAGHNRDPQHVYNEQTTSDDVKRHCVSAAASELDDGRAVACDALNTEDSEDSSLACVERVENVNQPSRDQAARDCDSPPLPSGDGGTPLDQVIVKQENQEEEGDGSACCLDSIKVEDFSPECMFAVQSKMLEDWKPEELEELDIHSQDSNTPLSCTGLPQAHPPSLTTNVPQPTDRPSLSAQFPNIFPLAEPALINPETPPQVYGVHVRTSRNHGHLALYTCKSCGQTFHLPSLLRRHYGQCQQKLQQCCQEPIAASRRNRLQLYPPGCSPFRCVECNREFNRMENLKTHLRIHTGERPYTCSVCSKCFRHSGALTRHFRIHTGEKPYICGQCGKSFRNCGGLKFHQRSHSKQLQ